MPTKRTALPIIVLSLSLSGVAIGGDAHREYTSHVHGVSRLDVAVDGPQLYLSLVSPAANLVGFEHPPRNDDQRGKADAATEQLRDAMTLFAPSPAADCRQVEVEVESPWEHDGHDHHDHDKHDHGHDDAHMHADFTAEYRLTCASPGALEGLTLGLFERFPLTERIDVQFVVGDRQGSARADRDQRYVAL
jgi:hypothetical protein